jgi:predicted heme/steroid binding protein
VSENGGAYVAYTGQISVGNVSRVQGYWKFKIRSAAGRNESSIVESPAFTIVNSTPSAPVVVADDATDILSASSTLGNSEIEVSENGGSYVAYTGQISVGNVSRVQGYWKFKIRSAAGRNESSIVESPAFTIVNSTPSAPVVVADDATDILSASSTLGNSELEVSENGGSYVAYTGQISVGNVSRVQGYWKFKIRSAAGRNESSIVESPAFTIVNSTPSAPVVSLVSLTRGSFTAPSNIVLSATASDADGSVSKVEFLVSATKIGEDMTAPYSITWSNVVEGNYIITAKATDNSGLTGFSQGMEIVVNKSLIAPIVKLTSPFNGGVFADPAKITLAADASDVDGSIIKVEFFSGSLKLGEDNTAPYSFSWNNVSYGSYTITAKATDNNGLTTTSDWCNCFSKWQQQIYSIS